MVDASRVLQEFERAGVPDDATRAALVGLLGVHAVPVWGWGQRDAYERMVMAGPGLDQWVRTAGLWAEMERMVWEWEQLVAALIDAAPNAALDQVAALASDTVDAGANWIDLMLRAACLDGLGEHVVRTFTTSAYAPLRRHSRTMVAYKRGQAADGCDAIRDVVRHRQLDPGVVEDRLLVWRDLCRRHALAIAAEHDRLAWSRLGLATPLDVDGALAAVDQRVDRYLRG